MMERFIFIYLSSTALEECQPEVSLPPEERKNMYVFKNQYLFIIFPFY